MTRSPAPISRATSIAVLTHPSSSPGEVYRAMADRLGFTLIHDNRRLGFKGLHHRWLVLVDEAQEGLDTITDGGAPAGRGHQARSDLSPCTSPSLSRNT